MAKRPNILALEGRYAGGRRGPAKGRPDHRRAAETARLRHRAVRKEPPRRDPFERADDNSNTYWDFVISHAYIIYAMQAVVAQEIDAFKRFPPRQKPAAFNLDAVLRALQDAGGSANH